MSGYPQFYFRISKNKICFSCMVINSAKIPLFYYASSLRNSSFSYHSERKQNVRAVTVAEGGTLINLSQAFTFARLEQFVKILKRKDLMCCLPSSLFYQIPEETFIFDILKIYQKIFVTRTDNSNIRIIIQ